MCKPNDCDNFRVGTEVHFMCSKGYELEPVNLSVQTCQPGGYWSGYASSQLRCSYGMANVIAFLLMMIQTNISQLILEY